MLKGKGWFLESRRHKLASLGIKTGRKVLPRKSKLNVLEGNPMFFPQSKEVLKIAELNYTATKLKMAGKEIDPIKLSSVARELEQKLREKGYSVNIDTVSGRLTFHDFRLIPEITGYNISAYTQKRGRILNWDDWIKVNKIVNQQLDKENISANVSSLGGKFVIRAGTEAKTERDWSTLSLENVGSEVSPVARRDAWKREQGYPQGILKDEFKFREKLAKDQSKLLQKSFEEHQRIIKSGTIAQEEAWSKRDLALRKKLEGEFQIAIGQFRKKGKLGYTSKYKASDIGAVATDVVVGTGAEIKKHAPLIALAKVKQWTRKKTKAIKRKTKKKKSRKKGLFYPQKRMIYFADVMKNGKRFRVFDVSKKSLDKHIIDNQLKVIKAGRIVNEPIAMKLHYPQAIKEKYPTVTKEITKLALEHNLRKPILKYGKNKRLATFFPPNTIKLSKKLVFRGRAKRKDVAQHEFKHFMDINRTNIRDVAELERRAVHFEKTTK